jgi:Family of unknown function (DUF6338)
MMVFMPTTLTGLLLFVVLLLPGFAYAIGKERNSAAQRPTPFRETAAVVAASVAFNLVVLVLFAAIRAIWPTVTPNVGALIRDAGGYLRGTPGQPGHYGEVGIWAVGMLALAVLLAYLATLPQVRAVAAKALGAYPHDSSASAWWILFEKWQMDRQVHVGCILDDGSFVEGTLGSFSRESDDSAERDLILAEPISYRPPGDTDASPYGSGAACVSAARIVVMFVSYSEKPVTSLPAEEAGAPASTSEQEPSASGPS